MYGYHSTVQTGGIEFELAAAYSVQDRDRKLASYELGASKMVRRRRGINHFFILGG